ncbi:MAG: DUF1641 domain-containing protein [Thermodesulfobacteriota bacterium]
MKNEELILDRLDRLENKITPMIESARSIKELKEELAPRVNEAVQALIVELADVESDFQLEDLLYLTKKAMRNVNNLSYSLDQLKNLIDFATTAEPLFKTTVPQIIYYLDALEKKGVFHLFKVCMDVFEKIGDKFTPEDMDQIGEGMIRLMDVAKKLTSPKALDFHDRIADMPETIDLSKAKDVGLFGMMGAMGDDDVKAGLGVLLELTKAMGTLKE